MRGLFAILFLISFHSISQNTDINTLRDIHLARNTSLDPTFEVITHSVTPVSVSIPTTMVIAGLIKKDSSLIHNGLYIGGSILASSIITVGLKYGIDRDRPFITYPEIEKLTHAGSPSFPSGHTSMAFSAATSLSITYPRWYVIAPSFLWASGVGYSRMHLGVHYPSDVFVGALIGSGSAWLCHILNKKIFGHKKSLTPLE